MSEQDFLSFDALRQTAQCVGRVIRSKLDYGLMIFADQRFNRVDKRSKLPGWIVQYLDKTHMNLSTDRALTIAKEFLKSMAQPRSQKEELGTTMLDEPTVTRMMQKARQEKEAALAAMEEGGEEEKITMGAGFMPSNNAGIPRAAPTPWTEADRRAAIARDAAAAAALASSAATPMAPTSAASATTGAAAKPTAMEMD